MHDGIFDRKLIFLLLAIVALDIVLANLGPANALDSRFFYSGAEAVEVLMGLGPELARSYLMNEAVDYVLLLTYTAALTIGLTRLYGRKRWVFVLAFLPGLCDFLENTVIVDALLQGASETSFGALGYVTATKWISGGLATLVFVTGWRMRRPMRPRRTG